MLKSKFFRGFDLGDNDGKEFKRSLDKLVELSQDLLLTLARDVPELTKLRTGAQTQDFIDAQVSRLAISRVDAGLAYDAIQRWLRLFTKERSKDDVPHHLVDDLLELKLISSSQVPKIESLIKILKDEVAPELHKLELEREYAQGVLPGVEQVKTTVELRAIRRWFLLAQHRAKPPAHIHAPIQACAVLERPRL